LIPLILGLVIGNRVIGRGEGKVIHGILASILVLAFTINPRMAVTLGTAHLLVPLGIHLFTQKWSEEKIEKFGIVGEVLMAVIALLVWSIFAPGFGRLWAALLAMILDYKVSLIALGYICMLWPISYIVKVCLLGIARSTTPSATSSPTEPDAERGGRMIGMFERVIIFTLVLLGEYSAIGFLITGKSIIRFAQSNEKIRSEYVLVGTMVSYAIAILAGVLVNWLLKLA
jgi:hypothetical protein